MSNFLLSLIAVIIMVVLAIFVAGNNSLSSMLMTIIPYVAFLVFTGGFIYRIVQWWTIPVPFRIPTTCGQQKSLPWLKKNSLDNPASFWSTAGRMALEVFLFRSLFRNTTVAISGQRPVYDSAKWLWFFGLLFHWSLLIIVLRHLRFFSEPLASWIAGLSALDGFFEIGLPTLYLSDAAVLAGLSFLFLRRLIIPRLRYLSLFVDYFALLLLLGIVLTGLLLRHFYPADLLAVKNIVRGWLTLAPIAPAGVGIFFYIHLFLVFALLAWFPFSKLMHMGGVFLSPTRMLASNNRSERHVNPWNAPVKVHTYEEYENEFRDKMKAAGLPVDKE